MINVEKKGGVQSPEFPPTPTKRESKCRKFFSWIFSRWPCFAPKNRTFTKIEITKQGDQDKKPSIELSSKIDDKASDSNQGGERLTPLMRTADKKWKEVVHKEKEEDEKKESRAKATRLASIEKTIILSPNSGNLHEQSDAVSDDQSLSPQQLQEKRKEKQQAITDRVRMSAQLDSKAIDIRYSLNERERALEFLAEKSHSDIAETVREVRSQYDILIDDTNKFIEGMKRKMRSKKGFPDELKGKINLIFEAFHQGLKAREKSNRDIFSTFINGMDDLLKEKDSILEDLTDTFSSLKKRKDLFDSGDTTSDALVPVGSSSVVVFRDPSNQQTREVERILRESITTDQRAKAIAKESLQKKLNQSNRTFSQSQKQLSDLPLDEMEERHAHVHRVTSEAFGKHHSRNFSHALQVVGAHMRQNSYHLANELKKSAERADTQKQEIIKLIEG